MAGHTICPRCGARDSFLKGYLLDTCVCRVCQSQLDWREIPGCGPDCQAMPSPGSEASGGTSSSGEDPTGGPPIDGRDPGEPAGGVPAPGSDA
jgi:hypothetical protein